MTEIFAGRSVKYVPIPAGEMLESVIFSAICALTVVVDEGIAMPLSAFARSVFGFRPARQSTARWLTSLGGIDGPQALTMQIGRIGDRLPGGPGLFLFASYSQKRWTCLFVGETADLRSRTTSHEVLPEAILLGATHIHYQQASDLEFRLRAAERLIFMHGPALNAVEAPLLKELIASPPLPPSGPDPVQAPRLVAQRSASNS